jgi:hypothetical protein
VLTTTAYRVKGKHRVDLQWTPTGPGNVDVYRNGVLVTTTINDGFHTDAMNAKGAAQYVHRVCVAGTAVCSNDSVSIFN